jgi:hypothetical protein
MKDPQGTATVERGVIVERRAPKTEQCELLCDLAHGIFPAHCRLAGAVKRISPINAIAFLLRYTHKTSRQLNL